MPFHRHPVATAPQQKGLSLFPIDGALVGRLKASYARVRASEARLAEVFYARLFAAAPGVRPMFRAEPDAQARKLMDALDAIVRNLERPAENASMLAALGRRHAQYGATPEHYALVVELLVGSMKEVLGPDADAQILEEWRLALHLIAAQMIAAAEQDTRSSPAARSNGAR
jgi:nitric oxide dioxygenase